MSNLAPQQKPSDQQEEQTKDKIKAFLYRRKYGFSKAIHRVRDTAGDPRAWLEIVALIVVGIYTYYAGQQSGTMNKTLREIKKQTRFAETSSKAATDAAGAARDAITQARDQFRQDQRPYVWGTNALGQPEFHNTPNTNPQTGQITWTFHFTDYGKSPAYHVVTHKWMSHGVGQPFRESYVGTSRPPRSTGEVLPPTKDDFTSAVSEPGMTPLEYQHLLGIDNAIRVQIQFEYTDAYGCHYETHICLGHLTLGAIQYCPEGNDITDCKEDKTKK